MGSAEIGARVAADVAKSDGEDALFLNATLGIDAVDQIRHCPWGRIRVWASRRDCFQTCYGRSQA